MRTKKDYSYGCYKDGHKVSIRFSDEQYDYLCWCAYEMRMSVSDFVRQIVDNNIRLSKGDNKNAHFKTDSNYKL